MIINTITNTDNHQLEDYDIDIYDDGIICIQINGTVNMENMSLCADITTEDARKLYLALKKVFDK